MSEWSEIEERRKRVGLPRSRLFRRADVAESTYHRALKHGYRPRQDTLERLDAVLKQAEREIVEKAQAVLDAGHGREGAG